MVRVKSKVPSTAGGGDSSVKPVQEQLEGKCEYFVWSRLLFVRVSRLSMSNKRARTMFFTKIISENCTCA